VENSANKVIHFLMVLRDKLFSKDGINNSPIFITQKQLSTSIWLLFRLSGNSNQ
jgi:hypothetical protein